MSWQGRRAAKLLQQAPVADCPVIQSITMDADFPVARLTFHDPALPLQASVVHFSPFIPGDAKQSAFPVVLSIFELVNPTPEPMTVALLACGLNAVGSWNVGRFNRVLRREGLVGLQCGRRHADARDARAGELVLATEVADAGRGLPPAEITYWASWMYARHPFRANWQDRHLAAWEPFASEGRLPNRADGPEATGELDEPMGAVAVRCVLPPGERREVAFAYAWFMPNHVHGHRYQQRFSGAWDAARVALRQRRPLLARTQAWHRVIRDAGLPGWLSDGLINSLAVYTATSCWTRDGRFAMFENPVKWPLMDSLDVRYYGSLPLTWWFPRLEQSTLLQFARAQRADGRIPHDLGRAQLECPSDGTTAGLPWKDLATKFTLMAYRDALWTGDRAFLRRIYPAVKRAMQWQFTTDRDGDGLPENEGYDSTFDLWAFYGASSYTSSIFLAALQAAAAMARLAGDQAFARVCQRWFRRGAASFEARLWTGSYYAGSRRQDGSMYDACLAGQLNGQWYAHLLGLGRLVPAAHARRAVETMLALNGTASRYGAVNAVFPDGRVDTSSYHAQNIWAGETYALTALAIYEGCGEEALGVSQRVWETFASHTKHVWSQPDVIVAEDGRLGDGEFYIRNVGIWAIPVALAQVDQRVWRMLKTLAPQLPLPPPRSVRTRRVVV